MARLMTGVWLIAFCLPFAETVAQAPALEWSVSLDGGKTFRPVRVPGTIEDQIQLDFDGLSIYQAKIPYQKLGEHQRLLLRFAAAATHAKVSINGTVVAEHLGGWTPFTVDITRFMRESSQAAALDLRVDVDEKVGHNTQGFLPIVTNHFSGLWQPVTLRTVSDSVIVEDAIAIIPDFASNTISVAIPINQPKGARVNLEMALAPLKLGTATPETVWPLTGPVTVETGSSHILGLDESAYEEVVVKGSLRVPFPLEKWSPENPQRYLLQLQPKAKGAGQEVGEAVSIPFAAREFVAGNDAFLLNGRPYGIRGLLNWGYAPPSVAPSLDESWMRQEIKFAQDRGFNLMKFCLWIPPKRYLELCDELGMLAWIEYPTWHPQLDQKHLAELRREYAEFFEFDRNHAAVVLRSLTCETGPSAELEVIRSLYEQCKAAIPGAVVEDDSSWISWNRIHDFYDDHPYGNNHTWVATLRGLKQYIAEHSPKPLALGEAIAADTWTPPTGKESPAPEKSPAHGPWAAADNWRWQNTIQKLAETRGRAFDPKLLQPQSAHYGMLMRKFQIETYQREVPHGAYVVSVIRDFPKASMGLIDYTNQPKHSPSAWAFHGPRMLLLQTENDRRSFDSGATSPLTLLVTGGTTGQTADVSQSESPACRLRLLNARQDVVVQVDARATPTDSRPQYKAEIRWPNVTTPERFVLEVTLENEKEKLASNAWPVWVFPVPQTKHRVTLHPSAIPLAESLPVEQAESTSGQSPLIVTRKLDAGLLQALRQGARVVMLPDGTEGSFPLNDHWFLRGSVVALPGVHENWDLSFDLATDQQTHRQNMLVELQHFDLAGPVLTNIGGFLELIDPLVLLWDNHDMREVKTHGLAFRMDVGAGRLFVTSLNHAGPTNSAGRWLWDAWLSQLQRDQLPMLPEAIGQATLARLESELNRQLLPLHDSEWHFQPDPQEQGVTARWFAPDHDDSQWSTIRVDRHWEGQGHKALDHWAWYRKTVRLPDDWHAPQTYLNFTGIDDYADIYVNGEKIASVGDIARKQTAFETRLSLDISKQVAAGKTLQISVAVYDWFGAGGIFRPVTLSTEPLSTNPPILK